MRKVVAYDPLQVREKLINFELGRLEEMLHTFNIDPHMDGLDVIKALELLDKVYGN